MASEGRNWANYQANHLPAHNDTLLIRKMDLRSTEFPNPDSHLTAAQDGTSPGSATAAREIPALSFPWLQTHSITAHLEKFPHFLGKMPVQHSWTRSASGSTCCELSSHQLGAALVLPADPPRSEPPQSQRWRFPAVLSTIHHTLSLGLQSSSLGIPGGKSTREILRKRLPEVVFWQDGSKPNHHNGSRR